MGNNRTSKTLEKGFVESELSHDENQRPKTLKKTDPVLFSNLTESCSVELARKIGNGSVEELVTSEGVNGHNQLNNGFLDINSQDKLLICNKVNKNVVSILEGDLKFSGNTGILVEEVDEGVEKGDVLHCHKPDSPTKIEVSGNGINLFVEVFGPLDEIDEGSNGGHILNGAIDPDQEYACDENETRSHHSKSASIKNEEEVDTIGEQECIFNVSDLVWVKTKSQLWWPGVISDPSSAAKDATKSEKRGSFLVKYYGSANFTWCSNSDMKPFLVYFEQFSRQNDSRNFVGSVEKALGEIGRRVKLKMTCPCFSKGCHPLAAHCSTKYKEENLMPMDNASKFGKDVLSLSQFEPASFYAGLRNLARVLSVPGKVELTVAKNRLSAFYCSIGHCQLPMQVLRPSGDTPQNAQYDLTSRVMEEGQNISGGSKNIVKGGGDVDCIATRRKKRNHRGEPESEVNGKLTSSGKDHESRERKKSKYLSYPYVDSNQKLEISSTVGQHETDDSKHLSSISEKSTLSSNLSGKNSRKRASRNAVKGHHIISKADNIDACSAELLTELRSIALDCFYASRSKFSDSLKRFLVSFRVFECLDPEIAHRIVQGHRVPRSEKCVIQKLADAEVQKEGTGMGKESIENGGIDLASGKESVRNKFPEQDYLQGPGNGKSGKAKKKKEILSGGLEPTNDLFNLGSKTTINNSWVISFQQPCSDVPKSKTTSKKIKKVGGTSKLLQFEITARLPDLNGNNPSISFENVPAGVSAIHQGTPVLENSKEGVVSPNINGVDQMKSFASVSSLKDVKVTPQSIPQLNNGHGINGTLNFQSAEFTVRESVSSVIGSPVHNSLQMGFLPSFVKPERKKRKRKDKTCQAGSVIPDLNGVPSDTISLGKILSEGNHTSPECEPPQKRRRIKCVSTESGTKGEDFGSILLLNFAPELPLPSKESLVATFSRFGLLKESQTQALNDSSVQIFYQRTSDAQFAFRSLEKNHQFGESLISFKFHRMAPASTTIEDQKKLLKLQPFPTVGRVKNPAKQNETPDFAFIKQNVEMMKMTLEKAGNNISPEMRAKLENEIKGFLSKIDSMVGSSAS